MIVLNHVLCIVLHASSRGCPCGQKGGSWRMYLICCVVYCCGYLPCGNCCKGNANYTHFLIGVWIHGICVWVWLSAPCVIPGLHAVRCDVDKGLSYGVFVASGAALKVIHSILTHAIPT